jgi:hypothetical protein
MANLGGVQLVSSLWFERSAKLLARSFYEGIIFARKFTGSVTRKLDSIGFSPTLTRLELAAESQVGWEEAEVMKSSIGDKTR